MPATLARKGVPSKISTEGASSIDTGPGIPLDQQGRIFDQFHRVDSSLTKAKGGTGLGLAFAKQIVEMHATSRA